MIMAKPKRITGEEVVKHRNELNAVRGTYSKLEEKLFVLVYSKLTGLETELPPISLLTTEVCRALGTKIEDMRRAMKRLTQIPIEVGHIDDLESPYELIMPIIRFIHVPKDKTITLTLNPALKDYFIAVKEQFTSYTAEHCYRLNSQYSIRIYKMLMQWNSKIEAYGEWDVKLNYEEMRDSFKFKPDQYKRTGNFTTKILKPALLDITNANIGISCELTDYYKSGLEITDYIITVTKVDAKEPKRIPKITKTKKDLSQDAFIEKFRTEYDEILESICATELKSRDLPLGIPPLSDYMMDLRHRSMALEELSKRHPEVKVIKLA